MIELQAITDWVALGFEVDFNFSKTLPCEAQLNRLSMNYWHGLEQNFQTRVFCVTIL